MTGGAASPDSHTPLIDPFGRGIEYLRVSVTALAARILAVEPHLNGASLKARIFSLATPMPAGTAPVSKHGWIAEPWKHFQPR